MMACAASSAVAQTIPAFPGAEGFGAYAKGGRGGDVYIVTNLNSSGAGSLADGIATAPSAGRTIVFAVSGYIHVPGSNLRITQSKITIAGQTAPGDGIGLKDGTFRISGDDIVIRHLRFRHGKYGSGGDCVDLDSGCIRAILDQVSLQFSTDENISSFNSPPENITMQWALNAWGLESHSCGGLWDQNHATCHHSLWAHNHTRNPKARPSGLLEWVNNVTFDWDIGFIMGDSETPADWKANVIGSYFLCPPGNIRSKALEKASLDRNGVPNFSLYLANCRHDSNANGVLDGTDKGYSIAGGNFTTLASPVANTGSLPVTPDDPTVAFKKVVSKAGALRLDIGYQGPIRDEVDTVLIGKLVNQQTGHITRESDLGVTGSGFGTLSSAPAPVDTDKDGMPDYFETALGWNVAAQDHNTTLPNSGGVISGTTYFPATTVAGYTRLEEYLHFLSIPHGTVPKNIVDTPSSVSVDLRKFTSGFASSPTFAVSNISGGTVTQNGAGNAVATFTPTLNYTGRARFDFTVTDSAGHSWTQTCALVVTNSSLPRDLVWKGAGNAWDESSLNWVRPAGGGATVAYSNGDRVAFDDSGSVQSNVTISSALTPTTVEVTAQSNYTLGGAGSIASTGTLTKRGTGTLTISHAETYANGISLEAGAINLGGSSGLSGGTLTMLDGTAFSNVQAAGTQSNVANAIDVPAGQAPTINTGNRIILSGALTGAGTLTCNVQTTVSRADLKGSMSAFTGDLLFRSGGGVRLFYVGGNFDGFNNATVDVGGTVGLQPQTNSGGNTLSIGALSGSSAGGNLAGGTAGTVTYVIGGKGTDTTFAGSINGNAAVTKTGSGTLNLTGSNTYTSATTINAGTLLVAGSLGNTATSIANGATLAGAGTIGSASGGAITAAAGARISPGNAPLAPGTLSVGNGLSLNTNSLTFDLSGSTSGPNDRITLNGGSLGITGLQTFQFNLLEGTLAAGNYTLIDGATTSIVANPGLTHDLPAGSRQTFTVKRSPAGSNPSLIWLEVLGSPATLTWTGTTSATWDAVTTTNWTGASPSNFTANDAVIFNDSSTVNNLAIAADVAPRSVQFNNTTRAYTLAGAAITGRGSLTKLGTGALTFNSANTYNGGTTIQSGATITLGNDTANGGALGSGPVTLNGGTLTMFSNLSTYTTGTFHLIVPAGQTGTFNADARSDIYGSLSGEGTLNLRIPWIRSTFFGDWSAFTGTLNVITDGNAEPGGGAPASGDLRMGTDYNYPGFPLASVNLGDKVSAYYVGTLSSGTGTTISVGELAGTATSTLLGGSTGGRNFIYRIGAKTPLNTEVTFAGTIQEQNASTTTSFVKTGPGIWRLSGNCSWNGGTTVEEGVLRISGNVSSGGANFAVESGATVDLANGTLTTGDLQIALGGRLSGRGIIQGDLSNHGTVTCGGGGALQVSGDVVNDGTMRFTDGTAVQAGGRLVNNGVLDLLTSGQALPANLENNGVVIDSSSLGLAKVTKSGGTMTISVRGYMQHVYQLQRADTIAGANWNNIGTAQAPSVDGQTLTFTDTPPAGAERYYRVAVTP